MTTMIIVHHGHIARSNAQPDICITLGDPIQMRYGNNNNLALFEI